MLKLASGGDQMTAWRIYGAPFRFTPRFKLWIVSNDPPALEGRDRGAWERIRAFPCPDSIPEAERDPRVRATLTDPAVSGAAILAWAVAGCLRWQRERLGFPPAVAQRVAELRSSGHLERFVGETLLIDPDAITPSADLQQAYLEWCQQRKEPSLVWRQVAQHLQLQHRCQPDKWHGQRVWRGLSLRFPQEPAQSGTRRTDVDTSMDT